MKPYFDKRYGTVTIANSCPVNDGSSLLLIMSEDQMNSLGLKPLASVCSSCFTGLEPQRMGLGPVYAAAGALKKAGLSLKDIDLIEINEAFAAQVSGLSQSLCLQKNFVRKSWDQIQPLGKSPRKS